VIAALSTLGVMAAIALTVGLILMNRPTKISVPDLTNMTAAQAQAELAKVSLTGTVGQPIFNATCQKDRVVAQDPAKGESVEEGKAVTYQLCGGVPSTKVPRLVGTNKAGAQQILNNLKLKAEFIEVDGVEAKDIVTATEPPADSPIAEGATVKVSLSKGNLKQVPNVVGKSRQDAEAILRAAGFTNIRVQDGATVNAGNNKIGTVERQDPEPGDGNKPVDRTTVTIWITKGPASPSPSPSG
jgi:serine/threonine-protein kinase